MKLMKRKTAAILLTGLMVFGLAGCGGGSKTGSSDAATGGNAVSESSESSTDQANISVENSTQGAMNESISLDLKHAGIGVEDEDALNSAMTDIPSLTDLLIVHDVMCDTDTPEYKSYQVIYYGNDTNTLKAVHVEEHYYKSAGYTEDMLKSFDLNQIYPGIKDLDFVKVSYTDKGDCFCSIIEYNQLDDPDHLDQLYDCGCAIEPEKGTGKVLAADSYKDLLTKNGFVEKGLLDIHTTYEE